jgi:DNA mismatch repair protein MutL
MHDIIKLLPDAIANQIAAGEVIQRPASVVKELLENAIDAGATELTLAVVDAGKTLIQISDNGCGMSETDARLSFERHATSKIKQSADLFAIKTFGFRGEALASIAAVAQVELKTKRIEDEIGTRICIENSNVTLQEPVACTNGTVFAVKNLFYNVPARRKFLKADSAEIKHITEEFIRVALAQPTLAFKFINNGNEIYNLRKQNLRQRIAAIVGESTSENLISMHESTSIASVEGFVCKPQAARKSRSSQYFFVNQRFVRDNYLHHAIVNAYNELLPAGQQPVYVLYINVRPDSIDINIHPTKTEIKFEDEKSVYSILYSTVKRTLAQFSVATTIDFDKDISDEIIGVGQKSTTTQAQLIERYNTNVRPSNHIGGYANASVGGTAQHAFLGKMSGVSTQTSALGGALAQQWDKLYEIARQNAPNDPQTELPNLTAETQANEKKVFQLHEKYIFAPIKSGMMAINQQLAHERILYEEILAQNDSQSQHNLFYEILQLTAEAAISLQEILPDLKAMGFVIQPADHDPNQMVITATPTQLKPSEAPDVIQIILNDYAQNPHQFKYNTKEYIARNIASRTCLKQGTPLTEPEMHSIIDRLFACKNPYHSPMGKPAVATYTLQEIEEKFRT